MLNLFRFVVLKHLSSKPLRVTLTTFGVLLGVALYITIKIINQSTLASYRDSIRSLSGNTTLTISTDWIGFPEDKVDLARGMTGVSFAIPQIKSRAHLPGRDGHDETLIVLGLDLLEEHSVWADTPSAGKMIKNPLSFLNHPNSIIVSQSFADEHGLKTGSTLALATVLGRRELVVRGILPADGPAEAYGGGIAVMDIDAARLAFGKQGKVDRVDVVTDEGVDVEEVARKLRAAYGPDYTVERPEGQAENLKRTLGPFQAMLTLFSSLALLVGLFLVANSIGISVAERRGEIGTLRALGATRKMVLLVFLSEAFVVGVTGSLLGTVLGRLSAKALLGWVSQAISEQARMSIQTTSLSFGTRDFFTALALGTAVSLVAALLPSLRATQIQPLEAIGNRATAPAELGVYRFFPVAGAALLVFLGVSSYFELGDRSKIISTVDQFSGLLGALLLGPKIFSLLVQGLRPMLSAMGGVLARLSTDNLLRNPKRTNGNVMSLMAGLLLVTMLSTINISFKNTIRGRYGKAVRPDLLASSFGQLSFKEQQRVGEAIGFEMAKTPGVAGVYAMSTLLVPYEGKKVELKAFDETDPSIHYGLFDMKDRPASEAGYELYHSPDPTVLVSENFTSIFHKKTGDKIKLSTPSGDIEARIVGVEIEPSVGGGLITMGRPLYKKLWKDSLVNVFAVQVQPGSDSNQVKKELERRFGESADIGFTSQAEVSDRVDAMIDQNFRYTHAIEIAALLVGFLGLLNTLIVSVMERKRELGMMRAIGMARKQVYGLIILEALLLGVFGSVISMGLGSWVSYLWITHSLVSRFGWLLEYYFPWSSVFTLVGTGVLITVGACLLPARRAAHLEIRDTLNHE